MEVITVGYKTMNDSGSEIGMIKKEILASVVVQRTLREAIFLDNYIHFKL